MWPWRGHVRLERSPRFACSTQRTLCPARHVGVALVWQKEYSPPTYFLWLLLFSSSFSPLSSLLAPRTSPGLALQWHQTVIYFDCSPSIVELLFFLYNFVQTLPFWSALCIQLEKVLFVGPVRVYWLTDQCDSIELSVYYSIFFLVRRIVRSNDSTGVRWRCETDRDASPVIEKRGEETSLN